MDAKAREQRHRAAIARPELRVSDGVPRTAPQSPTSAPIKQRDAAITDMVAEFLRRRQIETNR